jgi:hypothetical protein
MTLDTHQPRTCSHPIFIIGAPRSGTSILAWSLAHHDQLWTSHESHILDELYSDGHLYRAFDKARSRPGGTWLQAQGVEWSEFLRYLGFGFNALFTSRSQGKRWIDQSPSHTTMVEVVADMFPGAVFLHILRDGRRVVNSMINFADRNSDAAIAGYAKSGQPPHWATGDFREACKTWRHFVESSMDFCASNPTRCLTVVNEELSANPYKGFREIHEFLSLSHNTKPARYFRLARINSSYPSNDSYPTQQDLDQVNSEAFIMATPNPVPAGGKSGNTTISWSTGDSSWGQIYVSIDGRPEQFFTEGPTNDAEVPWIESGSTYEFRLYAGTEHSALLDTITVVRSDETTESSSNSRLDSSERAGVQNLSEPWKDWTPEQNAIFLAEAGPTLARYGLVTEDELKSSLT